MMLYVTDTHSLIWFFTEDPKLGKKALAVFQKAEEGKAIIIIPTIVLAEIMHISEKKKVDIKFKDVLEKLKISINYIPYNLSLNVLIKAQELTGISDIHDKVIVATALLSHAEVLTKDDNITNSKYAKTIW